MKVVNIENVNSFFETVDKCEGKVELVTQQGDCLNLRAKISQFVVMAKIVSDQNIQQGDIVSYNPEDTKILMEFMNSF